MLNASIKTIIRSTLLNILNFMVDVFFSYLHLKNVNQCDKTHKQYFDSFTNTSEIYILTNDVCLYIIPKILSLWKLFC